MTTLRDQLREQSLEDRALLLRVLVADLRDDASLEPHTRVVRGELDAATRSLAYVQKVLESRKEHTGEVTERLLTRESA